MNPVARATTWRRAGLGLAALAAWWIGSCDVPSDVLIPNQPPRIAISAGPIRDSVNVFIVGFNWNASDSDGQVVRFEFAIDTLDEWFETRAYGATLLFEADSLAGVDRIPFFNIFIERYRFRGSHTFYLRGFDDDGAASDTVSLSFTAQTFAPETEILIPTAARIVRLGRTFTVTWRGTDIDGTANPVGYSHRLVPISSVFIPSDSVEAALNDSTNIEVNPWSPFEPATSFTLRALEPGAYAFGVRALDQAGAVEPRLRDYHDPGPSNILILEASERGGQPRLSVSSSVKTVDFPNADPRESSFQIPSNANITFTWSADASAYGGRIAGYSYGLDLVNVDPDGPEDPGWSPESAALTRAVLRFDLPEGSLGEEHSLYVRARDDVGSVILGRLELTVVPLTRSRDVLLVDDFGRDYRGYVAADCIPSPICDPDIDPNCISSSVPFPQDQCHDQFLREALERGLSALGHADWVVDLYKPLEPRSGDVIRREPGPPDTTSFDYWLYTGPVTLENLGRYKLVVWNVRSESNGMLTHMNLEGNDNSLAVYVEAGGDVWIEGSGAFSRTLFGEAGVPTAVGTAPFGFTPRDFLYRFLKLESEIEAGECQAGCFRASGGSNLNQTQHGFDGAYASDMAAAEGYPGTLRVGRSPFDIPGEFSKGIPACEGMAGVGLGINPRLQPPARLDTLYFYESNGRLQLPNPYVSYMDDAATALRYSGPGQGRLMVWGFPIYFLPDEIDPLVTASLRWLLLEGN